ncbi:unnamed protein product [Phytomonas sp. Hart1]|nr:unnamed protein product [Phytomonas sp. Hart1]|eukprot:CCW71839.1 unnamed protein product [Phytomonas sp. isolate Hart1]
MIQRSLCWLEKLVIVESPNKVIKVEGLLSDPRVIPDWSFKNDRLKGLGTRPEKAIAMATTGHFMSLQEIIWTPHHITTRLPDDIDLPKNGVLANFELEWEILSGRHIQEAMSHNIKERSDNLTEIIVATDPDREGELIAVHALNLIKRLFPDLNVPFTRAYMHSITVDGIRTAMQERQELFDHNLANAAEARHTMDRIFGFLGSSVVRFANSQMRSIGRVQTPALILINEREKKITKFIETHKPEFQVRAMCTFPSRNGTRYSQLVQIKPVHQDKMSTTDWENKKSVEQLCSKWRLMSCSDFQVKGTPIIIPTVTNPPEPFTMSTLIAKANRQLHLSSENVNSCLQDLFQMGYITYPRTDSTRIDESVLSSIYEAIKSEFGKDMLYTLEARTSDEGQRASKRDQGKPNRRRHAVEKGNVEDAHEAIRPTDINIKADNLGKSISTSTRQIYDLICRNTIAAFMIPMKKERITAPIRLTAGNGEALEFNLEGKHTVEAGWSVAFRVGSGKGSQSIADAQLDAEAIENGIAVIPNISDEEFKAISELKSQLGRKGPNELKLESPCVQEYQAPPPLPYSEGGLIEELRNNGVGRPSTYPMIVKTLLARNYITINKGRCETTPIGRLLVETSKSTFPSIVNIGFTSSFEKKLDLIAKPEQNNKAFLSQYPNLTEADYVLSSFVSTFLNYITEATKNQRALIAERSLTIKREELMKKGQAEDEATFAETLKRENQNALAQVPDLIEFCKNYRTFTALQNSLGDYLRRHFPLMPPANWAPNKDGVGSFSPLSRGPCASSTYTSYTKYAAKKVAKKTASQRVKKVAKSRK